ncbi:uncharacterized protein LOC111249012 isoform X2 [Varroa destructor]|uniref:Sarcoglycan alpha/epsilon second domain-containing protein n=1 Tax=Varroa destructor TaxID=109461 RepID=A0A7M7JXF7_VARDE|nr:uncharacterized protein LOC111249012 isoform X2 [Varroa destructor]
MGEPIRSSVKSQVGRLEALPNGKKTSKAQQNNLSPSVSLISLFLCVGLVKGIAPDIVKADHGVSGVEFPPIEELSSPTDAVNKLTIASPETSYPKVVIFTNQLYRLRLLGLNNPIPVVGYPDLPRWTFLRPHKEDLLLYGSQPNSGLVNIQIISTDQQTFYVNIRQLQLQVEPREIAAPYEVEMKIISHNVEDVFEEDILPKFEGVLRELWSTSSVVFISKLASVLDVGGRRPLDPRDKEGFVLRVAGSGNFSSELRTLELEVRQLRNRIPCPRHYKRTSAEWRFRKINVQIDWCGFRLITNVGSLSRGNTGDGPSGLLSALDNNSFPSTRSSEVAAAAAASNVDVEVQYPSPPRSHDGLDSATQDGNGTTKGEWHGTETAAPTFEGPSLQDLPRRSSFEDIVVSLALPLAMCIILLGGLSGTSICLYASDEPSGSNTTTTSGRRGNTEVEDTRGPRSSFRPGKN